MLVVGVLDRSIGFLGLAFSVISLIVQQRYPRVSKWVTDVGRVFGCVLIGLAIAPFVNEKLAGPIPPPTPSVATTAPTPSTRATRSPELTKALNETASLRAQLSEAQAEIAKLKAMPAYQHDQQLRDELKHWERPAPATPPLPSPNTVDERLQKGTF